GPLTGVFARLAVLIDTSLEFVDTTAEFLERGNHGLDTLRTQAQLFDQSHRTATPTAELFPGPAASRLGLRFAHGRDVILAATFEQFSQRTQVMRQTAKDLLLFEPIGYRNLHRTIEGQIAIVNAL